MLVGGEECGLVTAR
jgi:hypothetical protein